MDGTLTPARGVTTFRLSHEAGQSTNSSYTFSSSSPNSGGALYNRAGVSARLMGEPESLILPAVGCSHSHTNPRAWMCGSLKAWLTVLIGPHGMPAARSSGS